MMYNAFSEFINSVRKPDSVAENKSGAIVNIPQTPMVAHKTPDLFPIMRAARAPGESRRIDRSLEK
ncbi:MAG: hypothetical protein HN572_09775 [Kordiimonadaceae bacterium]|nr:hypothetical protein [Kordiimonadaceae bacterium]